MVAVDTNILARLIVKDVPQQAKQAHEVLAKAKPRSLLLDRLIICEFDYVLESFYKYDHADRVKIMRSLTADERYHIPDRELVELAAGLFESEKSLSFENCWLLALKRAGHVSSVATFDRALAKRV